MMLSLALSLSLNHRLLSEAEKGVGKERQKIREMVWLTPLCIEESICETPS